MLSKIKKNKKLLIIIGIIILLVAGGFFRFSRPVPQTHVEEQEEQEIEIVVDPATELIYVDTYEEYYEEYKNLIGQYDDDRVTSGAQPTARVIVAFRGRTLDLSGYKAEKVIAKHLEEEDNSVAIQFVNSQDAEECAEELNEKEDIIAAVDALQSINAPEAWDGSGALSFGGSQNKKYTSDYTDYEYYSWGITDMGLDQLAASLKKTAARNSVVVAVIDTGVEVNNEISDRLLRGKNFTGYGTDDGWSPAHGHGSHVAGVILNATQGLDVKVLPLRIFGRYEDSAYTGDIVNALRYAGDQNVDVINMSIGGFANVIEDNAVRQAVKKGITVVIASGNEAADTAVCTPARVDEGIIVGAYNKNHKIAYFSNYGDTVDVAAPGVDVLSYWNLAQNDGYTTREGVTVKLDTGTSMAAPHISALAAMIKLAAPDAVPAQVEKYIKDYCDGSGDESHYGAGICQASMLAE